MKRILLVEDEESLINVLELNFELEGYQTVVARDGESALEQATHQSFDLVVLDIMLPKMNGFDVCKRMRSRSQVPIIITSAKGTSTDRIKGLKSGADDYLVKPFNLEELFLRIDRLVNRHSSDGADEVYEFGPNRVNFKTYQITGRTGDVLLSKRELDLLKLLISRKNEVVSRSEILDKIWGKDHFPSSRTIDNYILNFRKYFEQNPRKPVYFISLRGVGYKFVEN